MTMDFLLLLLLFFRKIYYLFRYLTYGVKLWNTTIKTILVFIQLVPELSFYTVELVFLFTLAIEILYVTISVRLCFLGQVAASKAQQC